MEVSLLGDIIDHKSSIKKEGGDKLGPGGEIWKPPF